MTINAERLEVELRALVDHANVRGLTAADIPLICAVTCGLLTRSEVDSVDGRRHVIAGLYEIMQDHAGIKDQGTH